MNRPPSEMLAEHFAACTVCTDPVYCAMGHKLNERAHAAGNAGLALTIYARHVDDCAECRPGTRCQAAEDIFMGLFA